MVLTTNQQHLEQPQVLLLSLWWLKSGNVSEEVRMSIMADGPEPMIIKKAFCEDKMIDQHYVEGNFLIVEYIEREHDFAITNI